MQAEHFGRLAAASDEELQRGRASSDPGAYHGDIAARELHWHDGNDWVNLSPEDEWQGLGTANGSTRDAGHATDWRPWHTAFDDTTAPFYRWFAGARTNACFNEVDRHVLRGNGAKMAIYFEGDRWDPSRNDGRGGPVQQVEVSYRQLLVETVLRAEVLKSLGLTKVS